MKELHYDLEFEKLGSEPKEIRPGRPPRVCFLVAYHVLSRNIGRHYS